MNKNFLQSVVYGNAPQSLTSLSGEPADGGRFDAPLIVPLPQDLVVMLEQAHQGQADQSTFETWLLGLREVLRCKSQRLLHAGEEASLAEADAKSLELESTFKRGDYVAAAEAAFLLFRSINRFEIQREKNRQSKLDGVNEFLICALSHLEGRAEAPLVLEALEGAVSDIDRMVELSKLGESVLPEVVKQAFLRGIDRAADGVEALRAWDLSDKEHLKKAIALIFDGASLLGTLQDWKDENDRASQGSVPFAGGTVQRMLLQITEKGFVKEGTLNTWHNESYPKLLDFWHANRATLLLKSHFRQQLIHDTDRLMAELADMASLDPGTQQRLLSGLEDLFHRMSIHRLELDKMSQDAKRWRADLILAVIAGGVPSYYLRQTIEEMRTDGNLDTAQALESFMLEGDAAEIVLELEGVLGRV